MASSNGIYKVAYDYHENDETKARIDRFVESERPNGKKPHILPQKHSGCWRGEMEVYSHDQERLGVNQVEIRYAPLDLLRAEMDVRCSGVIDRQWKFGRTRQNYRHHFTGPDLYGSSMAYGRALYNQPTFLWRIAQNQRPRISDR